MSSPLPPSDCFRSGSQTTPSRDLTAGARHVNGYHASPKEVASGGDSPSVQLLQEYRSSSGRRSTSSRNATPNARRVNGYQSSPHESIAISPSHQLLEEFGKMLLDEDRTFKHSLDEQTSFQQRLHLDALDRALAKHEEVRESAERIRERVELEIEAERRRRAVEERRAADKVRREVAEQELAEERRQLEESKARERERDKKQSLRKDQEESQRKIEGQRQQEAEEKARKEKEEVEAANKKAKQEAEVREAEKQTAPQKTSPTERQPNGVSTATKSPPLTAQMSASKGVDAVEGLPQGLVSGIAEREAVHNQYLDLHKRLKQMREHVSNETKKVPGLKNRLSEWRRAIQKCCGQLSKVVSEEGKTSNRRATQEIVQHLDAAAQVAEPSINVTQYVVDNQQPPGASPQGPACLLFLLNHFAKNIVGQFISESAVDPKSAEPIGVLAVTIFARPQYLFNGQSLIDILWAKYHKRCPLLFGISGSERTRQGRARLGWQLDVSTGQYVRDQEHYDRMSGLGVGFAAITLRDFSKSKNANPAPNRTYWQSLARILNTPAQETQPTHFIVLKAMIDLYVPRIMSLFGGAGLAVLRQALVVFPNERGPQDEKGRKVPAVLAVQAMPMVLQRDFHITL